MTRGIARARIRPTRILGCGLFVVAGGVAAYEVLLLLLVGRECNAPGDIGWVAMLDRLASPRLDDGATLMGFDVTAPLDIPATTDAVAAIEFDPMQDPRWIGGVDRVEWLTEPPIGVDSEVRRLGGCMGRPIEWVMHVEGFEPGRLVAMRAVKSPFPMQVDYPVRSLLNSTRW